MTKKNNIVEIYVRYFHEKIEPEEMEQRRLHFALLLVDVAQHIHGSEVALSICLHILHDSFMSRTKGEPAPKA